MGRRLLLCGTSRVVKRSAGARGFASAARRCRLASGSLSILAKEKSKGVESDLDQSCGSGLVIPSWGQARGFACHNGREAAVLSKELGHGP